MYLHAQICCILHWCAKLCPPRVLHNGKSALECPRGKWVPGYLPTPWDLGWSVSLNSRGTNLSPVSCVLCWSLQMAWLLKRHLYFSSQSHPQNPRVSELWDLVPNLSSLCPQCSGTEKVSGKKLGENFLQYLGPLLWGNQDPSETFQVDSVTPLALYWNSFITVNGTIPLRNYSAVWERSSQYGHNKRPNFIFFKCTKFPLTSV